MLFFNLYLPYKFSKIILTIITQRIYSILKNLIAISLGYIQKILSYHKVNHLN